MYAFGTGGAAGADDAILRPSKPYGAPDRGYGHRGYAAISMTYLVAGGVYGLAFRPDRQNVPFANRGGMGIRLPGRGAACPRRCTRRACLVLGQCLRRYASDRQPCSERFWGPGHDRQCRGMVYRPGGRPAGMRRFLHGQGGRSGVRSAQDPVPEMAGNGSANTEKHFLAHGWAVHGVPGYPRTVNSPPFPATNRQALSNAQCT